jgi:hypothetical protein
MSMGCTQANSEKGPPSPPPRTVLAWCELPGVLSEGRLLTDEQVLALLDCAVALRKKHREWPQRHPYDEEGVTPYQQVFVTRAPIERIDMIGRPVRFRSQGEWCESSRCDALQFVDCERLFVVLRGEARNHAPIAATLRDWHRRSAEERAGHQLRLTLWHNHLANFISDATIVAIGACSDPKG